MRKSAKVLSAVAVAGLAFAGSTAYTAGNTFASGATAPLTGYATTTVSGATVNSLDYNLNAAGDQISSVTLVLATDTTTSSVSMNFNGGTSFGCGTGTMSGTTTIITTYTCTPASAQSTSTLASTGVVVN